MSSLPSSRPDFDRVYEELRALARRRLAAGLGGGSLQATGLVHEVWLKLSGEEGPGPRDASHFYATAAQAMRWILVDRARRRRLARRSGGGESEFEALAVAPEGGEDAALLRLDAALERLEAIYPRKAQVVLHRHFAGLSVEETARHLGLSTATVKREWSFARAWLLAQVEETGDR